MESQGQTPLLNQIRGAVRQKLTQSTAFRQLSPDKQKQIAHDTVNALNYILGGEQGQSIPRSMTLSGNTGAFVPSDAMAGAVPVTAPLSPTGGRGAATAPGEPPAPLRRDQKPGQLGEAARAGGQAFTDVIADVNFPAFVGGLIDGVFNSIVTTSIKQMEAYADMVKNVSKSVDQYMKDNVTENHARDYLAERYPDFLQVDVAGEKPQLKARDGADDSNLPDFFNDLGLKAPVSSIDDDTVEQQLVPGARRRIAMDRQQLLATMVMMGVNRLVVTNGTIEASCMFELDTSDVRKRDVATQKDYERQQLKASESGTDGSYGSTNKADGKMSIGGDDNFSASSSWSNQRDLKQSWYSKSSSSDMAKFKMHTTSSRADEQTINMHAQLTGKVKVNFKSDYFPMEKMIDAFQVNMIQEKTSVGLAPRTQQAPGIAPPPPPPMPALPAIGGAPAPALPPAAPRT